MDHQAATTAPNAQRSFRSGLLCTPSRYRVLLLLVCAGAGLLSVILGPDNYWDLRYYHLYAPWAYLHGRTLYDIGPAQEQGFLNPTADFLLYGLISSPLNNAPRLVAFIMGAVHGINAALLVAIVRHVIRPPDRVERWTLRAAAWLMGVSGAGFVSLLGTSSNDLTSALFVLGSLLGLLKVAQPAAGRGIRLGFAAAGLWGGVGLGLKYTSAVYVPGLAAVTLLAALRRRTVVGVIVFGVALGLGFLGVAGHHLLALWNAFGNPFFPYLNQIFHSPYFEPTAIRDDRFVVHDLQTLLTFPFYWAKTNTYVVSEPTFRDWRAAIAYGAMVAGVLGYAARRLRQARGLPRQACGESATTTEPRPGLGAVTGRFHTLPEAPPHPDLLPACGEKEPTGLVARAPSRLDAAAPAPTRGLGLIFAFVVVSYVTWAIGFGYYRYVVPLEMLTGVVTIGSLLWVFDDRRLRIGAAVAVLAVAAVTTIYLNWGRRPYTDTYVSVSVPPLPDDGIVLIATWDPAAYFIPYANPTVRYLGIENNYLEISQNNKLAAEVKRLMRTPGPPKFVLSVGDFDRGKLNKLLANFDLRLSAAPCRPIHSNLEDQALSLCAAE
jgi:hypothetical protein